MTERSSLSERLERFPWFTRLGCEEAFRSEQSFKTQVVDDWDAAKSAVAGDWASVLQELFGRMSVAARKLGPKLHRELIDFGKGAEVEIGSSIPEQLAFLGEHLGEEGRKLSSFILAAAAMEREFGEKLDSRFFSHLEGVFASGHIPCGWQGGLRKRREKGRELTTAERVAVGTLLYY
ncbi:MAG: hypothetical protein MK135_17230 [Polyangiaceae bacterium]|nr:hypothetical protein [Polyangiaceae bacterium]